MKYAYTIIYVSSVENILEFYKKAFGFDVKFIYESKAYGELRTGKTTLAFTSHEMGDMNLKSNYSKANIDEKPFGIEGVCSCLITKCKSTYKQCPSLKRVVSSIHLKIGGSEHDRTIVCIPNWGRHEPWTFRS
ncbi:MAG: hypothetical protein JRF06_01265 [Deltaproteobacteria bacterium]|nr:hypothetical protein [Deltaproteobacteria bacterium]